MDAQHASTPPTTGHALGSDPRTDAERANRAKSEFLSAMSHELRTPLNAIAGYAELLELGVHGPVTDEQRDDLRRIRRNQAALLSLVNDVLNFARLEAGRPEIESVPVPVAPLVADIAPLVEPHFASKRLRYEVRPIDPSIVARDDAEPAGRRPRPRDQPRAGAGDGGRDRGGERGGRREHVRAAAGGGIGAGLAAGTARRGASGISDEGRPDASGRVRHLRRGSTRCDGCNGSDGILFRPVGGHGATSRER